MPEVEFPPDVAEPLLDGVVPEAVAPEDAASGAAALETVASGGNSTSGKASPGTGDKDKDAPKS